MARTYRVNQRVEATVEKVLSFGVFARLDDGSRAYIRRRNLDLDADAEPEDIVQEGQRIEGVIVALNANGGHIELSRRAALPDPWLAFAKEFQAGDVVTGEVRRLAPSGVFVRVAAGLQGYLPLAEMAPWPVERPENLLWLGDRVEATILSLSAPNRKMVLSVRDHLAKRDRALELYEDLFLKEQPGEVRRPAKEERSRVVTINPDAPQIAGKLLILEDDYPLRHSLGIWFRRRGMEVTEAASIQTARENCADRDFDFLLLDLSLPDGDGLDLAREFSRHSHPPHIFIMSSSENLIERLDDFQGCQIAQIFPKPLDMAEIQECLAQLALGGSVQFFKPTRLNQTPLGGADSPQLLEMDESQVSIQERLEQALAQVHKSTKAQNTILFRQDTVTQAYLIQAIIGEDGISPDQIYQLGDSPVKDVIRTGSPVVEGRAQLTAKARYQKLLDLLPFESCLGLPLQVQGECTHALFFFHSEFDAFSRYRQRDARAGAFLIAALLEEAAADHRIQALSPLLINGQLASGFGHEIANQISNLELELINHLTGQSEPAESSKLLADLLERVQDLKATTLSFQRILWSGNETTDCDLHAVLDHAYQSVKPFARKNKTMIRLHFCPNIPLIRADPIALQQVFVNVLLNAVQQIGLKFEKKAWSGVRRVEVHTCHSELPGMVAVRIHDTGPGIHRRLWKNVFKAGFSTRGGSGMGLYISQ
jgi:signal transduction histidine kinase/predicted RNA-binding protein with RPS1 domain/ActR/RegA family two-component response regulator